MKNGVQNDKKQFDDFVKHDHKILTTIYSLDWVVSYDDMKDYLVEDETFYLGRLKKFYLQYMDQFPKIVGVYEKDKPKIIFEKANSNVKVDSIKTYLLVLPSNQILAVDILKFNSSLKNTVLVMEDFYYHSLEIEGYAMLNYHKNLLNDNNKSVGGYGFTYHQILTSDKKYIASEINKDLVQKIIYRADLPYREEYSAIKFPTELNRRPNTFCGVGPFVTANGGHQGYMENCMLLSALSIVGSVNKIKLIREEIRESLLIFGNIEYKSMNYKQKRELMNRMNEKALQMKLESSLFVELVTNIGLLVPSLRVESYHSSIYSANNIQNLIKMTSEMLGDFEKLILFEKNRISIYERGNDEAHKSMWAVIISFISVISIPPSIILAFLSSGVQEVGTDSPSLFDLKTYGGLYGTIVISILLAIAVGVIVRFYSKPKIDNNKSTKR
ncbi:hypothetical protein RJI07_04045 [Mycoplasmatota bacterium WC30]